MGAVMVVAEAPVAAVVVAQQQQPVAVAPVARVLTGLNSI
jgi:hypothetical protein